VNLQKKKNKDNEHVRIGTDFLNKKFLDVQVKVMELDDRPEARYAEGIVGECLKSQGWPSTAVKKGQNPFLVNVCLVLYFPLSELLYATPSHVMLFDVCAGGAGKAPSAAGRMDNGKRSGDCIMIDFYRKGSLKSNGVVLNPHRKNNSTSFPILLRQELEMQKLD